MDGQINFHYDVSFLISTPHLIAQILGNPGKFLNLAGHQMTVQFSTVTETLEWNSVPISTPQA